MGANNILLGGDGNANSDRWDPQCPPKRDGVCLTKLMDEYDLTEATDGKVTDLCNGNGEVSTSPIDCLITKTVMSGKLEISTDLTTISDHTVVHAK
jgi:hypothetical protein